MGNSCARGPANEKPEPGAVEILTDVPCPQLVSIADTWNHVRNKCSDGDKGKHVAHVRCKDAAVPMTLEPLQPGFPSPLVIGAHGKDHTATVILLHGLGDTAHGWSDGWGPRLCSIQHCKWVLPTAPTVRSVQASDHH